MSAYILRVETNEGVASLQGRVVNSAEALFDTLKEIGVKRVKVTVSSPNAEPILHLEWRT